MNHLFNKKRKKIFEQGLLPGTPTNTAGPVSHQAESSIGPEDERTGGGSRIGFQHGMDEDQGLPATGAWTSGVGSGGADRRYNPTDEDTGDGGGRMREPTEESRVVKRARKGTVLEGPAIHINTTGEVTEGFDSLKVVLGSIPAVYANALGTVAVGNKIEDLLSRIVALEARFTTRPGDIAELRRRSELIRKFKDIEGQLSSWSEKPRPQQPVDRAQDDEVVPGLLEDLRESISVYQMDHRMAMSDQGRGPINPAEVAILNNFRSAQDAEYRHGGRKGCLKGTRIPILDEIERWSRDFNKPPVYWLNGLAGTGKSTIAQTIAERFSAEGQLGASFFCSRDFEDRSNLHFIFPTLAVQLARRYTEFRSIFIPLVQSDPGIASESLYNQMEKLIVQPIKKSAVSTGIVIDALDECREEEPASTILSVLGQFVSQIPETKFFVTGRPESQIREGFRLPPLAPMTDVFVLHEVELGQVNNDIRRFFRHRFTELASRRLGLDGWPTVDQLDLLCERTAGLFIYAVATVRFIDHKNNSPKKQLDRLLQSPRSSVFEGKTKFKGSATLDSLYTSILQEAFGDNDPEDDPKVRSVLGAVTLAMYPLPPSAIAALLDFDTEEVFPLLSSVHSFLVLQDDVDQPVRPFHKSFPDFIIDPARCANPRFCVCPPDHHMELLVGCLELMNWKLKQNMCELPDGVLNSEVHDLSARTGKNIDRALTYACKSWHKHLIATAPAHRPQITLLLHQFLEGKFLFWLEVLSLLGVAREAAGALNAATKWLDNDASPTLDLVHDFSRFAVGFFEIINSSAPHIYHSALPLSPQTSIVCKLYKQYAHPLARVVWGFPISWEPSVATVSHHGSAEQATWSPCGRYIAVSLYLLSLTEILDAVTLERLHTFESTGLIRSLGFSPDGRSLTGCTDNCELWIWDLQTGGRISIIPTKRPPTFSLPLSPVYSIDGKMVAVAYTDLVTICDLSGTHACSHRVTEGRIVAPLWTHGECLRFITVKPGFITIWEVGFTPTHTPAQVGALPAPHNIGDVATTLFLPTLSRFASFRQGTLIIWDALNSKLLLSSPASGHTRGMSFSSDGRFFAYGTSGQGSLLWKDSPVGYVLHRKLSSSTGTPTKPLFSPNGESIITSGGLETRLWRTTDPVIPLPIIETRPTPTTDFLLDFSPDGSLAATARWGGNMITVLNLSSGNPRLIIDTGIRIWALKVNGVAIVVVGEGWIITWNLPAGDHVIDAGVNIKDSVRTIKFDHPMLTQSAISPDFKYIILIFGDLSIYDMSTGSRVASSVIGFGEKSMVWVTPDGCEVWISPRQGWKIIKDVKSDIIRVESLRAAPPSGGYPWESFRGHEVTDGGWILNSGKKRLMWLPHHWREYILSRKWCGQFLGLSHGGLSEAIVIQLGE